jgi:hypothetical protein
VVVHSPRVAKVEREQRPEQPRHRRHEGEDAEHWMRERPVEALGEGIDPPIVLTRRNINEDIVCPDGQRFERAVSGQVRGRCRRRSREGAANRGLQRVHPLTLTGNHRHHWYSETRRQALHVHGEPAPLREIYHVQGNDDAIA